MVRIGVVGGGKFGLMHLRTFTQLKRDGKAELVALADINEPLLKEREKEFSVKGYTDYREMIEKEDLDGIGIATPDFLHRKITVDCLNAGKHVLVEKPLEVTTEGCTEMIDTAKKNNRLLQVDFHKRYDPYHKENEKVVREGRIGKVLYGYAFMEDRIEVPRDWFPNWAPKSSPVWFLGVHMIDLFMWITKCKKGRRVFGTAQRGKLRGLGVDTLDSVSATVEFDNGVGFCLNVSWILPDKFEGIVNQGIRIIGTEGIIEVDSQNRGSQICTAESGMITPNLGFFLESKDKFGKDVYSGYGVESIADFVYNVEYLKSGGKIEDLKGTFCDGESAREVTRIAESIHKSVESGKNELI